MTRVAVPFSDCLLKHFSITQRGTKRGISKEGHSRC